MRLPIRFKGTPPKRSASEKKNIPACEVDSKNCVSSINQKESDLYVAPLSYGARPEQAALMELKKLVLTNIESAILAEEDVGYLRFEVESEFFGFVDDLEFCFKREQQLIQMRSASRIGRSDFGVNKKRVEKIQSLWNKKGVGLH